MRARAALIAALLIGAAAVAVFWPGVAMFDSVTQYGQVLSGRYDDWHPPIMARLWSVLHALSGGGATPMLVLQVALYAIGFGLIADALVAAGRGRAAVAVLAFTASPLLLGWQVVVLKDAQMEGALLAAVGIVAAYWLRDRTVPITAMIVVAPLIAYATLVRGNALFATVPLAVLLLPQPRAMLARGALIVAGVGSVLLITPVVNHRLLDAEPTAVAKSQAIFDLAGIAARTPPAPGDAFTVEERAQLLSRHCVKAFFWDPLGDDSACGAIIARVREEDGATLSAALARAGRDHPFAYVRHRLAHWNMTERWAVPPGLIGAGPTAISEPNALGLTSPASPLARQWDLRASAEAGTPLGWPIVWTFIAAIAGLIAVRRRDDAAGLLALALAGSAIGLEASFVVISIASDLRYHLWPMTAAALAAILLIDGTPVRRTIVIGGVAGLAAIIAVGAYMRTTLPPAPATYRAMIEAPTG